MLEACRTLDDCETQLQTAVEGVRLLGELSFTSRDVARLGALIRTELAGDDGEERLFAGEWAACVSCFLVWIGALQYGDDGFWPAVQETVGHCDPARHESWAGVFFSFLDDAGKPTFTIDGVAVDGGHRYVTPILLHAGIPLAFLPDLFEHVLEPELKREPAFGDSRERVAEWLTPYRKEERNRRERVEELGVLRARHEVLERRLARLQQTIALLPKLRELWDLESLATAKGLSATPSVTSAEQALQEHRALVDAAIADLTEQERLLRDNLSRDCRISAVDRERAEAVLTATQAAMCRLDAVDQAAARSVEIESLLHREGEKVLASPWQDEYGEALQQVDLDRLRQHGCRLAQLRGRQIACLAKLEQGDGPWSSLALTAPMICAALATIVGFVEGAIGWFASLVGSDWRPEGAARRCELAEARHAFASLGDDLALERAAVAKLLSRLPVDTDVLERFSPDTAEAIARLAALWQELRALRQVRAQALEMVKGAEEQAVAVARPLGLEPQPGRVADLLREMLTTADDEAAQRVQAERRLGEVVLQLQGLRAQLASIDDAIAQPVEETQSRLGAGSVSADAVALRKMLEDEHGSLARFEGLAREADKRGDGPLVLQRDVEAAGEELASVSARMRDLEHDLECYGIPWQMADRPVRRFLLHGGEAAEALCFRVVRLLVRARDGATLDREEPGLAADVMEQFRVWWAKRNQPVETHKGPQPSAGLSGLTLKLDAERAEIALHLPPQTVPMSRALGLVLVVHANGCEPQAYPLRAYREDADTARTEEVTLPLPCVASVYHVRLRGGDSALAEASTDGVRGQVPYRAFSGRTRKAIVGAELPQGRVWLAAPEGCSVAPATAAVAEPVRLGIPWNGYSLHDLDLSGVKYLELSYQGRTELVSVRTTAGEVGLEGGELVPGVTCEGAPVYGGELPRLRLPVGDESDLELWSVRVGSGPEAPLLPLTQWRQSLQLDRERGSAYVPISDGRASPSLPWREYVLVARGPGALAWQCSIVHVDRLQVRWERRCYGPCRPAALLEQGVRADVLLPYGVTMETTAPVASFVGDSASGMHCLSMPEGLSVVSAELKSSRGESLRLALSVPRLEWLVQEGSVLQSGVPWRQSLEEEWLGDWKTMQEPYLLLRLPPAGLDAITLGLGEGDGPLLECQPTDGVAAFRLSAFFDALRTGPSVQTLVTWPRLGGDLLGPLPVLDVRTRWEVADVEVQERHDQGRVYLRVHWRQENGRTDGMNKLVRLWSSKAESFLLEQGLPDRPWEASLSVERDRLPPGRYLLQFALRDDWQSVERPLEGYPNTVVIDVKGPVAARRGALRTVSAAGGAVYWLPEGMYRLRVVGRIIQRRPKGVTRCDDMLITRDNEGWYVGLLEAPPRYENEQSEVRSANPVKFPIAEEGSRLLAIEDRDGDGAMYCRWCHRLYWSREVVAQEQRLKHPLVGPVDCVEMAWED